MNTTPASNRPLRAPLIALAIAAFATLSVRARAEDLDTITVTGPVVKTIGRDIGTLAPVEQVSVSATVATDPSTLRTDSGVALFKDNIREAARKACEAADPLRPDDGTCVRNALAAAKPQVDAAIADARNRVNG
jgi:UrcA family protein